MALHIVRFEVLLWASCGEAVGQPVCAAVYESAGRISYFGGLHRKLPQTDILVVRSNGQIWGWKLLIPLSSCLSASVLPHCIAVGPRYSSLGVRHPRCVGSILTYSMVQSPS